MPNCPNCAQVIEEGLKVCPSCGRPVNFKVPREQAEAKEEARKVQVEQAKASGVEKEFECWAVDEKGNKCAGTIKGTDRESVRKLLISQGYTVQDVFERKPEEEMLKKRVHQQEVFIFWFVVVAAVVVIGFILKIILSAKH